jgi:hypothetical protein
MKKHPSTGRRRVFALLLLGLSLLPMAAVAQVTPIIERGDEWRYLDTGTTPPAIGGVSSWKAANYNAAAVGSPWKVGNGLFGYGDLINYGTTLNSANPATPNTKYITHYFWKSFQLPANAIYGTTGTATYNAFLLRIVRDDAVAVYVNGTEIFLVGPDRDNLPPSGAINNTTLALNPLEGQSETSTFNLIELRDLLKPFPQNNVIAVELHQASNTTTDARFDLAMDLVTSEPCFGDSRPGIDANFTNVGDSVGSSIIHERDPLEEPFAPDYSFDEQDTEMNWKTTASGDAGLFFGPTLTEYVTNAQFEDNALGFWFGSPLVWESEIIDLRNYKDVVVAARVLGVKASTVANWGTGDRLDFTLRISGDGLTFRDLPWQRITSTASPNTSTAWTDLVGESAIKRAIVPTAANNPLNTGAGNWRTRAFDDSTWPSGTKGAGYENNPGDATNYNDLIDPSLDLKSSLFGASPKKSVIYMRAVFPAVPDRASFPSLRLLMKFDDGYVVYLNDQEVARKYVATTVVPTVPTAALPTPASLATQGNADTNAVIAEEIDIKAHLSKISLTEPNVLAVYALNDKLDSSDMLISPVLQIGKPGGPPPISLNSITPALTDPPEFPASSFTQTDSSQSGPNGTSLIPNGTLSMRLRISGTMTAPLTGKGFYVDDIEIRGTPITPDSFDNFMALKAPTYPEDQRIGKGDVDGDSVKNIHEYAFGSDPVLPGLTTPVNGVPQSIEPEVYTDREGYAYIRFRLPGGDVTGNPGIGYEILDLNIRPQISFGGFEEDAWKDEVNAVPYFQQDGPFVENNDGTVTVTCRTIDRLVRTNASLYLRLRVGVRFPSSMNGIDTPCYRP